MRKPFVALVALVALGACAADENRAAPTSLTGIVVEVDAHGLGDVRSFTLRAGDRTYEIAVDPRRDYGFPPGHLGQHRTTLEPVRVELEEVDGKLVAVSIEDA